jgi:hypothetical protein
MQRFRPKVAVEAVQITDDMSIAAIIGWMNGHHWHVHVHGEKRPFGLRFVNADGDTVIADIGDWIVRGTTGHFFRVTARAFSTQYEPERTPDVDQ